MEVGISSQGGLNTSTNTVKASNNIETTTTSISKSTVKEKVTEKVSEKEVSKAVDKLNKLFEDKSTHVQYEVYGKFHNITIRIIDDKTDQVIKEIPPKKLIDMVDKLCEMAGILVDEKA